MTTITSKRHFIKFYLTLLLASLFFLGMATVLLVVFIKQVEEGQVKLKNLILPIFSTVLYGLGIYLFHSYKKNAPKITLDKFSLSINDKSYFLSDIQYVELTGKRPFRYIFYYPMEATTLKFITGEKEYIFDDMYSNAWEIKSFLKQVVIDKNEYVEPTKNSIDKHSLSFDYFETYKGTVITSLRGMSLWFPIIILSLAIFSGPTQMPLKFSIFFWGYLLFWFLLHSYLMNYFQVSENYLVVRNHNFFWTKKAYYLSEIKEVVFETQGKMPNCLRVITKDFRNKLYPAGTLRDKTWLELQDKLKTHNIKVRNECI